MRIKRRVVLKHLLVVVLSFSIEVKVKADDYLIENQNGKIEVEKLSDGSTDIQTYQAAQLKIKSGGVSLGVNQNSFITLSKKKQIHIGSVFVQTNDISNFILHTKHGKILADKNSTYLVNVNKSKTTVMVLLGEVSLSDRINTQSKKIEAGYQVSIGGLFTDGKKYWSELSAHDMRLAENAINLFSDTANESKNIELDHVRIAWKKAVDDVSIQAQNKVREGLKILHKYQQEEEKRRIASDLERKEIKKIFREKTLGLPGQNKEVPLE
ncbi:MAG: hypothetical protein IPM57_02980 [Oligoflexia bacterium]|nr:hypothetical protein [Oligoflexia bacterium]